MDLPVQHNFTLAHNLTLARLWAWMKVELTEKASSDNIVASKEGCKSAPSKTDQQELKGLRRSSYAEKATSDQGSQMAQLLRPEDTPLQSPVHIVNASMNDSSPSSGNGFGTWLAETWKRNGPVDAMMRLTKALIAADDVPSGKASGSSSTSSSMVTGEHLSTTPDSLIAADPLNDFDVTPMLQVYSPVDVEDLYDAVQKIPHEEAFEGSSLSRGQMSCPPKPITSSNMLDSPLDKLTERDLPKAQLWTKPGARKHKESLSRRIDEASEALEKEISNKYAVKLEEEIEKLANAHQDEIEHLKQARTAEKARANENELKRSLLANELTHREGLLIEKDNMIANKDREARNAYISADTLHAHLHGDDPCVKLIRKLHETESELRNDLRIVVDQNRELQHSLMTADEQIKVGKGRMSRLTLELKDQATNLRQTTKLLRADDVKYTFLETIQDNAAEVAVLRAQEKSRTQEIQGLYRAKLGFEQSMYKHVAEIQEKALDEIDEWRNDFNLEREKVRRLEAEKEIWQREKDGLTHRVTVYSAEGRATETVLDQITAITQDIFLADGKEQVRPQLHVTKSSQILSRFQAIVCHFEAKIAALQRQGGRYEAKFSREVDGDRRVLIPTAGSSQGEEDASLSKKAGNPEASAKPWTVGVAPNLNLNGTVKQNNEPTGSKKQEPNAGYHPTFLTDFVAPGGQTSSHFTQTPIDTAFGSRGITQSPSSAPKTSIDLGFGGMSSGPMFKFKSGQGSSEGAQPGLPDRKTQRESYEQAAVGRTANNDFDLEDSVLEETAITQDAYTSQTPTPKSRQTDTGKSEKTNGARAQASELSAVEITLK